MADVELRELRLFLVLAEELHFGRTAQRLGLTTSRASQTLRSLERKLGGRRLVDRTSRVVTLTHAGETLRDELAVSVSGLDDVLERARVRGAGPGLIRVGGVRKCGAERGDHPVRGGVRRSLGAAGESSVR